LQFFGFLLKEAKNMNHKTSITEPSSAFFVSWAAEAYRTKKEAADFLEISLDPYDYATGVLIKKYAGVLIPE
jgi:hypothetical protein